MSQQPPAHLSPTMKQWWRDVIANYQLESHHLHLLRLACEAFDRAQDAREQLAKSKSLTTRTRDGGVRANPLIAIERDARLAYARILRELDLDAGAASQPSRPPGLISNRRPNPHARVMVPMPARNNGAA
jgi:P27 family predicted phage terminase small subunit